MNSHRPRIGVVTWPVLEAGVGPLRALVEVLQPCASELRIITGGAASRPFADARPGLHLHLVEQRPSTSALARVVNSAITQLKISWRLSRTARHVDFWVFFFGGAVLVLPMLTAILRRKAVVLVLTGSASEDTRAQMGSLISKVVALLMKLNYALATRIVVYSKNLVKEWGLEAHQHKISIARDLFIDLSRFTAARPLQERDNLVGYIGRLSQEKGILNFLEGIPKMAERRGGLAFLIGGDGPLRNQVEEYARMSEKVRFEGWVPHDNLPDRLNQLRLLVIPSYTEAGPYIAFEAMACGTPVLGTPVGLMADMITDGETGFIMKNNSPECIAENIIRALNHPDLEQIAENARALVAREFTYDRAVETYRRILEDLLHSR